ncbi:hypothetical protein BOX15_Mlig019099g6 [Macrostomum lignano]|uniref:Protein kinase domain-containing protein n=1 Tax=Macrostomum lignano TaxID=282301 RepID=A0A267GJE0_9PLAT|nr:hypothetical protein BOX15_Mlig019099g6 [Macrostomum lignano]
MSRPLYSASYCRVNVAGDGASNAGATVALPVRWMSWEAALHGRFSSRSDAWSFAVLLWELLTFCRSCALAQLTDQQVVENCRRVMDGEQSALRPSRPTDCQRELYDLMSECWQRDESRRPRFREMHLFLRRKCIGFCAETDWLMRHLTLADG